MARPIPATVLREQRHRLVANGHPQPAPAARRSRPSAYRYFRGRDLVASGTGWVERVVIDEPETSSYFTPISICLNVDSFEQLEFETRPDQLIVYALVEGDERVVLEYAPPASATRPRRCPASSRSTRAASSRWSCWQRPTTTRADRSSGAGGHAGPARATDPASDFLANVRHPERGGRTDAALGEGRGRAGEHHHGHDVRERREELGRKLDAVAPAG